MRLKTQYIKYNKINNNSRNSRQTIKIKSIESQRHKQCAIKRNYLIIRNNKKR